MFVGVTQGDHEFVLVNMFYNRLLLTFTISFTGRLGLPAATSGTLIQQWNFRDTLTYAGTFVLHVMIWGRQIHVCRLIQLYIGHYICSQLTFLDKEFLFAYCMFYFSYWMFCMTFKLGDDDETEWPYKPWGYTCAYRSTHTKIFILAKENDKRVCAKVER